MNGRPLIVSDCDEVLLHMIAPFRAWLAEAHGIDFTLRHDFSQAMRRQDTGEIIAAEEVWRLLGAFFDGEMHRQSPIAGAAEAVAELGRHADIVVLTNLQDTRREARARQLAEHGIALRVFTNQGPKGPALRAILDEYKPAHAIFIDDLAQHHGSVAGLAPHVDRLHLCGEPSLAPLIECAHRAGHAHARIDAWTDALPWLLERLRVPARRQEPV